MRQSDISHHAGHEKGQKDGILKRAATASMEELMLVDRNRGGLRDTDKSCFIACEELCRGATQADKKDN